MLSFAQRVSCVALVLSTSIALGCRSTGARFLSLIGIQQDPLVVALVMDTRPADVAESFNPFPKYAELQKSLQADLGRPVTVEPCLLFQAEAGLNSGWYQMAVLRPAHYAQVAAPSQYPPVAIPVDAAGNATEQALLVVAVDSEYQEIPQLRGQVVAFGSADDAVTYHAGLQLLRDHGLERADLTLEALPVPGSLKHFPNARAVAMSVINGSSDAGFVRESAWSQWPDKTDDEARPAQDRLRIIGRTVPLPIRVVVASPKLDPDTIAAVQEALLAVDERHPEVLKPLQLSQYIAPKPTLIKACRALHVRDQQPSESAAPTTAPAGP